MNESLYSPFPYRDTDKIQEDFSKELADEVFLKPDLTSYWVNIAGSLSYALHGDSKGIPQSQIE